ncbi:hypothetical protein BO71DRAFT_205047 [Aspergillus ellipticus CBS 707.79]|uniref:Uncharacterized protein n=1 Tax=Aspergillus ellipticus CBS 707.79 TaxID=1448320 RepID=A0A319DD06_9EURO|nr:hypothetical protein BO71DRAFT_205047 [Aspergillus ellipticus CBS 707.79]
MYFCCLNARHNTTVWHRYHIIHGAQSIPSLHSQTEADTNSTARFSITYYQIHGRSNTHTHRTPSHPIQSIPPTQPITHSTHSISPTRPDQTIRKSHDYYSYCYIKIRARPSLKFPSVPIIELNKVKSGSVVIKESHVVRRRHIIRPPLILVTRFKLFEKRALTSAEVAYRATPQSGPKETGTEYHDL